MVTLTDADTALIVQTFQVCSSRNVFKLQEYTHVKNVYDYFVALQANKSEAEVQPVADVCKIIQVISERGGFCLPEFETIHRLYQRLETLISAGSGAIPAPSTDP